MNCEDRIGLTQTPASVDHFLRATLHFRITALHRIKVEIRRVLARRHAGCRTAAHANAHAFATELNQQGARWERNFVNVNIRHGAQAARDHDGLVIAVNGVANALLEGAEIATQHRATELIVERRAANRPLNHDVQCRGNTVRLANMCGCRFPRLRQARQAQI